MSASLRPLRWVLARLRRPRIWVGLLLVAVVAALAAPYLWAAYAHRAARRCLAAHRPRQARDWLHHSLRVWPRDAELHLLAGRAARLAGDYDAAERHLAECQRLEGKPSDASVLEWALLRAENGNVKTVERFLRSEAERNPAQKVVILRALAAGYLQLYRFFDAMQCLDECLRLDPDDPQALYLRGRAWERVHAYPKAAEDYEQALARDPDHDDARLHLANCRLENGEPVQALPHLEVLRQRQPDNPDVLIRLAFAWSRVGRLEESIRLVDQVLERCPDLAMVHSARGQLAFEAEHLEEAAGWLRKAVDANAYDRQALYVLYHCLVRQGKMAEAEETKKRLDEAEETITRLITISNRLMPRSPHDPALHCELGKLLTKMGHEEVGVSWYLSALELNPNYRPAHAALAQHYERAGQLEQAARHRQQAESHP